jgi:hypothetical protein
MLVRKESLEERVTEHALNKKTDISKGKHGPGLFSFRGTSLTPAIMDTTRVYKQKDSLRPTRPAPSLLPPVMSWGELYSSGPSH